MNRAASATIALVLLFVPALAGATVDPAGVPTLELPALDLELLAAEDAAREAVGEPFRFAEPYPVFLAPDTNGGWQELGDGTSRWRLRIRSVNAATLNFGFTRYRLPASGRLTIAAVAGSAAPSAVETAVYTAADNRDHGELWTPVIAAREVLIELTVDTAERGEVELRLGSINQGYRGFETDVGARPGLATKSGSCNVDVACPQSAGWSQQIRSVARISISGAFLCSGAMLNNTAQDLRPLFLTATHCGVTANNDQTVVSYWNYQNSTCRTPGSAASGGAGNGSLSRSIMGSVHLASFVPSDFTLLELSSAPNPAWGVYWAGWDRSTGLAPNAVGIHHPQGQEKRISFENDPITPTAYLASGSNSGANHLRVADWDLGTTEGGSSGSPLFNHRKRVVGQLHGGFAACGNNLADWYGRLSTSWNGGGSAASRLRDHLDPIGSNVAVLDGRAQSSQPPSNKPAKPSNLTATALSDTSVELAWSDNSNNETSFEVELRPEGGSFVFIGAVPADSVGAVVTGLAPGSVYTFRVRARNASAASGYSNEATVETPSVPPAAPDRVKVESLSATSLELTWRDRADNEDAFVVEMRAIGPVFPSAGAAGKGLGTWVEVATLAAGSESYTATGLAAGTTHNFRVRATNAAGESVAVEAAGTTRQAVTGTPCTSGAENLCLLSNRFSVDVFWHNFRLGTTGTGKSIVGTDQSGYFWFFDPTNVELVTKMVDGTSLPDGSFWFFYGALTDLEYWIRVTDTESGDVATYYNPPRNVSGDADTTAFGPGPTPTAGIAGRRLAPVRLPLAVGDEAAPSAAARAPRQTSGGCVEDDDTLCLLDGRISVEVDWRNHRTGATGIGGAVPGFDSAVRGTGFFWFFNPNNVELVVKVLDGRASNGHFWFFYGALSDVEYEIRVTDTVGGGQAVYQNEGGNISGDADTTAIPE